MVLKAAQGRCGLTEPASPRPRVDPWISYPAFLKSLPFGEVVGAKVVGTKDGDPDRPGSPASHA